MHAYAKGNARLGNTRGHGALADELGRRVAKDFRIAVRLAQIDHDGVVGLGLLAIQKGYSRQCPTFGDRAGGV